MDEVTRVKCNWCESIFDEDRIKFEAETEEEICPVCGKVGCLMDITGE